MAQTQFQQKCWDLTDILPAHSGPKFDAELQKLKGDVQQFESMKRKLSPKIPVDNFVRALRLYEGIRENLSRFSKYALLFFRQDMSNQEAKSFKNQMDNLEADVLSKTLFFEHWLIKLDDNTSNRLTMSLTSDDSHYVQSLKRKKPHILGLEVEKQIKIKDVTGAKKWVQFYLQKVGKFSYNFQINGERRKLTEGEVTSLWYSPNSKERVASYRTWLREHEKYADELGEIYITTMIDWNNERLRSRHYSTPMSSVTLEDDVPDEVADLVLSKCRENCDIFRRFFSIKTRMLGMKRMNRYHLYAPLQMSEKKIPHSDAVNLVLDTYTSFDRRMGDLARMMFEQDHVNSEIRENKYSGAYCEQVNPKITPYPSYSYTKSIDGLFSIMHEVGHGDHYMFASKHSHLLFEPQTPVAEIASMFGELLLLDKLMEIENDPKVKPSFLLLSLNKFYRIIPRQAYFTIFEKAAHDVVDSGVTVNKLAELYLSGLKEQFGDVVYVPENFKWEWLGIPHIFNTPFYCYSYSFGNLLAISLYKQFKEEGDPFKPKYINLLSYGGSESPEKMLAEVGVDIRSEKFWQGGFDIINGMVNELGKYR